MTKTYMQLQKQIAKLQQEAEALRAKEVAGVIARIQEAINHYGLTPDDLFASTGPKVRKAKPAGRAVASAKPAKAKKQASPPKYTDGQGKTWTGVGKRPGWFVAALAAGKTAKDLEIAAAQA